MTSIKGTIGGLDGDKNFWCGECIEADDAIAEVITEYLSTLTAGRFKCNGCDKLIENQPHVDAPKTVSDSYHCDTCGHRYFPTTEAGEKRLQERGCFATEYCRGKLVKEAEPEQTIILSFCSECGALLEPGLGTEENPECPNCGSEVRTRLQRAEGSFSITDARVLEIANFGAPMSMATKEGK